MAENLIETSVSPKQLTFKPGGSPTSFDVTVINDSDRFASFQLEVLAAGVDSKRSSDWYSISPEVSTKKPPGDLTQFHVAIKDTPVPGFVGLMNLEVRVFSMELPGEGREMLRLLLEQGAGAIPLKVDLPVREFQSYPGSQIDILVRVYNPGHLFTNAVLRCLGLEPAWLINGIERRLQVAPGKQIETVFSCQLPDVTQVASQVYFFKIEATHANSPPTWVEGKLEVLPMGLVEFTCHPQEHQIPGRLGWLPNWRSDPVTYELQFENRSNLHQQVSVAAIAGEDEKDYTVELVPEQTDIEPSKTTQMKLVARSRRHWLGREKTLLLEAVPTLSDQRLGSTNPTAQILKLKVLPIIPSWLLMLGGALLLWLLWSLSWLNPNNSNFGHKDPVNSVRFNGVGQKLVSGSNDQTLIEWNVSGFFNPLGSQEIGKIGEQVDKAVRVVRYRPVNNNWVAAGLENGEIQLRDLLDHRGKVIKSFSYQKEDRVLALEFTQDSRYLFSGHGSGLVLQWNVGDNLKTSSETTFSNKQLLRGNNFGFVVSALKFVGKGDRNLAVAGRFNKLVVWDLVNNKLRPVPYPRVGSQDDYIFSIDTAEFQPDRLVTADKQGYITLWNLATCLDDAQQCRPLDEWSSGHGGKPVRAVALSADGCYLASGGDDGRMMLWPLTPEGKRADQFSKGIEIGKSRDHKKINTIDVKGVNNFILIASGSDDHLVRVKREQRLPQLGCDSP